MTPTPRISLPIVVTIGLPAAGCSGTPKETVVDLGATADRLFREFIIVDTHVDLPYRLHDEFQDVTVGTPDGDFDYPRARAGGLDAPFMSIYVPAGLQEKGGSKDLADALIDMVEGIADSAPDKFVVARSPDDVRAAHADGLIALPMGMENGSPVEGDFANLAHFHDRGIRYITLAHSENNEICDSSYADERTWNGLSPFGREGVGDSLPEGLKDVSGYPNLIRALLEAGYSEDDVRKMCGENLLRVWTEVEEVAARLQQGQG